MPIVSYRKKVWKRRKRRLVPHKRIFKIKSIIPKRRIYIHKGKPFIFKVRPQRTRMFRSFNLWIIPKHQKPFKQQYTPPKKPTISKEVWKTKKKDWGRVWQTSAYKELYKPKETRFPPSLASWARQPFIREKLKTRQKAPKAAKKVERRGGKREYVWKGKYYGVEKALGPKLIFELIPTTEYYMYIRARKNYGDHKTVVKAIRKAMQKIVDDLTKYTEKVVGKYVPKDTGDLRKAMIDSIKKSKVRGLRLTVELDTGNLKYANWVNNMPEHKIRHDMVTKQVSRKTGRFLHDPKAVEGWWKYIGMQLKTEAKKLLVIFINDVITAFRFKYFKKKPTLKQKIYIKRKPVSITHLGASRQPITETVERINKTFLGIESVDEQDKLEMSKHLRMNKYRLDYEKTVKESRLVEYPKDIIKGMFKIRGLLKS